MTTSTKPSGRKRSQSQKRARPPLALAIAAVDTQAQLSRAQTTFNTLIKRIGKKRQTLTEWDDLSGPFQRKYTNELEPLVKALETLQVDLVHALDLACDQKGLNRTERQTAAGVISNLAGELVGKYGDESLKAIYNKHSQSDFDKEEAANVNGLKSMLEQKLGVELGDNADFDSTEDLLRHAQEIFQQTHADYYADQQARDERRARRRKSAKQLAKEAQQEAEALKVSQSIREIYRKLSSALHPDREPDPEERQRKTGLMQRVNEAYDKNNLLQLLELQLELEHIDQKAVNGINEDRLKHYNIILKQQLADLEQEVRLVEARFKGQFNLPPYAALSPVSVNKRLSRDIANFKHAIADLQHHLREFADIKKIKLWLRELRRRPAAHEYDEHPF